METISGKISIGLLEGKGNWDTWKYKVMCLLKSIPGALEIVQGTLESPVVPSTGAGDAAYVTNLEKFVKADANALLILTTNMKEDTLRMVMRFTKARDVWLELHRLFDGTNEDKAYNLCMSFFGYKKDPVDDIATHMSKLKNIWTLLNQEMKKDNDKELPELLLICKILNTLSEAYFSFRSSWLLLPKTERTVESLTSHLCAFERALQSKEVLKQEALVSNCGTQSTEKKDKKIKCNYCQAIGHRVRNCEKWIKDGKPPKSRNQQPTAPSSNSINLILMSIEHKEVFSIDRDTQNWYVDNGATSHVTNRADLFQNFEHFDETHTVTTASGNTTRALGKGSVILEGSVKGKRQRVLLQDVWYVPAISKNLFSVLAVHDRIPKSLFSSTTRECTVFVNGEASLIGRRQEQGGLYKLDVITVPPSNPPEVYATSATMQLYHERLAHQNKRHVKATVKRELGLDLPLVKELCEGCVYGKAHRLKFGTRTRASAPGELVHTDVCGPFQQSYSKYQYYVVFKDDYTSYRMVYFLRHKSEVKDKLALMINQVKTEGHTIKCLLSDNGGEFDNTSIREILDNHGIKQRLVMPYTPEQNGVSERENRTLVETARSMMYAHEPLPQKLWAELINTAAYILNRTGPTNKEKSPYELWNGKKPSIKHLRIIGCTAYVHIPKQKRKKLDKKATRGRLVGYDEDGYRIWITDGNRNMLVRSRDVTFEEKPFPIDENDNEPSVEENTREYILLIPLENACGNEEPASSLEIHQDHPIINEPEGEVVEPEPDSIISETEEVVEPERERQIFSDPVSSTDEEEEPFLDSIDEEQPEQRYNLRDRSTNRLPGKFTDYVMFMDTSLEPQSYEEAMKVNCEHWAKAMKKEIKALEEKEVWTLQQLPSDRKALPCKWVFRIKNNPDGSIDKYKARLVVKGFRQRKDVDYKETFSPVARLSTIRSLLSVAAAEKMYLVQFDVITAFLNGKLSEVIYMKQPEGFDDGTGRVCRLNRSLYGLKQAPRCWNACFSDILLEMDFQASEADPCLYTKKIGEKKLLITLYVDDGLVAATDKRLAELFLQDLRNKLEITTKPATYYLGIEISQSTDGSVFITQEAYAKRLLERFGMSECNPVSTPIEKATLDKPTDSEETKRFPYREAVGSLAYLMVGTRPDIAYAVGVVSRHLEKPSLSDWLQVKRILRYIKGTTSFGIKYLSDQSKSIEAFSDADLGGDLDTGRSTTGVICRFGGGAVSWLSQRQASVAISTTEAEIVAASEAAREIIWIKRVFEVLTDIKDIPRLLVDNQAAIRLAHNPEFHKRTKHIRLRHFFVRELVLSEIITVEKTSSESQLADIFTKALPRLRFGSLREALGMFAVDKLTQ